MKETNNLDKITYSNYDSDIWKVNFNANLCKLSSDSKFVNSVTIL